MPRLSLAILTLLFINKFCYGSELVDGLEPSSSSLLQPFSSDGCSAFPDGTFAQKQLWLRCCTEHDLAYWQGGSYAQRAQADAELRLCVAEVGEPEIAMLMLAGVRVGGSPYFPTQFRWAYGWPYGRFYQALTDAEKEQVNRLKPTLPLALPEPETK
ncbi:FAD-binding oxidoreductase [Agaribacterium sp. ZY112]|uniref:FAD-binding oxidoreductase n=1 Tax=Agaribacterium sp. ZY112 TaxID=3233574 RepID=UPI003525E381